MASGSGPSLGDAVLDLVHPVTPEPPKRSTKQQVAYVLSPKTGASVGSVARQAGVSTRTVRSWASGGKLSNASAASVNKLFGHFWGLNNKPNPRPRILTRKLKISVSPNPTITIGPPGKRREMYSITVERSSRRKWDPVFAAADATDAFEAFVAGVLGPSPLPPVSPDYLWFGEGNYTITDE